MKEEQIDRRAHWLQVGGTLLVLGTVAFVTIKLTVSQLADEFNQYKRDMKQTIKELDNRVDNVSDRLIHLEDWRDLSKMRK